MVANALFPAELGPPDMKGFSYERYQSPYR
ncbi:hypothetical protein MP213Fo_26930 [Pseudochrobactrum sp. MP213Fo]